MDRRVRASTVLCQCCVKAFIMSIHLFYFGQSIYIYCSSMCICVSILYVLDRLSFPCNPFSCLVFWSSEFILALTKTTAQPHDWLSPRF